MCGGYNALKDFWKTEVFELARWRSMNVPQGALGPGGEVIPMRIITKPPSAELREDQKDEDSLRITSYNVCYTKLLRFPIVNEIENNKAIGSEIFIALGM